jgi:diacylglycerol kinase
LLAFELINTAIEKLSNKITKDYDIEIKDLSSSAVFVILLLLFIVLIITFI